MSHTARLWLMRTDHAERLCLEFKAVAVDCAINGLSFGESMIAFRGAAVERQETIKTMLTEQAVDEAKRDAKSMQRKTGVVLPPGLRDRRGRPGR